MSECAKLMMKWADSARVHDRITRGDLKRAGRVFEFETYGAETTTDHYRAAYLAAQLIAGTYTC